MGGGVIVDSTPSIEYGTHGDKPISCIEEARDRVDGDEE